MLAKRLSKGGLRLVASSAIGKGVVTDEFMIRLRTKLEDVGVRPATIYWTNTIRAGNKYARHLMVRAAIREDACGATIRRVRIDSNLNILEQVDEERKLEQPLDSRTFRTDPRREMGDYTDEDDLTH